MSEKQTVKFGDICREVKLTTKDPIADGYERYIGLEHLDSGSLKIKRWGMIAEDNPSFTRVFKKGHILFGRRRAYLKKAGIAEFDGICSGDIVVMEAKGNSKLGSLLPYIVQSEAFWGWAVKTSAGGLSPRTKFKDLSNFSFSERTDNEIKILGSALLALDKAQSNFRQFDSLAITFFECLVNSLTRYGTRKEKLKETNVGTIPCSWNVYPLKKLLVSGTKNGLYKGQEHYGIGLKMVYMGDMFHSSQITEDIIEQSVDVEAKELASFGLMKGDLLFARRSLTKEGAGLCCMFSGTDNSATFESSIIRARFDLRKVNPSYFNYFFRSKYGRWLMERIIQTVAASGITGSDLKEMALPVPSKDEQDEIAKVLDQISAILQQKKDNNQSHEVLMNCLVSQLVKPVDM